MDASPLQSWFESQPEVRRCQLMAESKDLVAWLQLDAATPELLRRLSARLEREGLDPRLAPRRLYGLQHFPLNANGKVDLAALQEAASDPLHIKAVSWDPDEGAPAIGIELDSLDQAQLLTQWRRTNLLWCGGGLNALGTDCPAGLGLLKLAFPEPHEGEKPESKRCMADLAKEQVEELLALKDGDLGDQIWLGGFSMAAWWAYALAWELEQRGQPVRGVILLDPVNPYSSVYRWCWRRWLADQWRKGWGSRFYRDLDQSQRVKKGLRQTLLGKWQVKALGNATLLVLQSRWRRHLPRQRAQALAKVVEVMTLDTHSHESVLTHPEIVAAWRHRVREWIGYGR
jgi:thioesterase domain-containing protein